MIDQRTCYLSHDAKTTGIPQTGIQTFNMNRHPALSWPASRHHVIIVGHSTLPYHHPVNYNKEIVGILRKAVNHDPFIRNEDARHVHAIKP